MYNQPASTKSVGRDVYHIATLAELKADPIFAIASLRPLTKPEVEMYLQTKERIRNFSEPRQFDPFADF
jgi:hypothetical protein